MQRSPAHTNPRIPSHWEQQPPSTAPASKPALARCQYPLKALAQPGDEQLAEMTAVLKDVVEYLGIDGCGLIALGSADAEAMAVHYFQDNAAFVTPSGGVLRQLFPWTHQKLLEGTIVCFSTPADLPSPAALDRLQFEAAGIQRYLAVPIEIGGAVEFCLVAYGSDPPRRPGTVSLLRLVAEILIMSLSGEFREADPEASLERLLPSISRRLINVAAERVHSEIRATLEQAREFLGFDRLALATFSAQGHGICVTHVSHDNGISPLPENVDLAPLFPWTREQLLKEQPVQFALVEELPAAAATDRQSWQSLGVKTHLSLPVAVGGAVHYLVMASQLREPRSLPPTLIPPLRLLGELFANALIRCGAEAAQLEAHAEIQRLKEKLHSEAEHLPAEVISTQRYDDIVGQSAPLARTLALVEQVAPTGSTVLISGETGTGKELVAQAIHKLGARRNRPMVKVNCASLPAALVESELFGREKGAYTGALTRQAGRFEMADGGTIFLDEIAEMSLELQAKLLRVLQEGQFERLGSGKTIQVDVRVIAATNRNLADEVKKGNFREDLYYRLNVFQIVVPPLRERAEDIPLLVWSFIREFGEKMGKKINRISRHDMAALQSYPWPGNVRELRNVLEHAVIVSTSDCLQVRLPEKTLEAQGIKTLEEYEVMHIKEALRSTGWRIKGEGGAARLLGLNPSTLYSRMQKLGIGNRPSKDEISH